MKRTWNGYNLPKGILIERGSVYYRIYHDKKQVQKSFGPVHNPESLSQALKALESTRTKIHQKKIKETQKVITLSEAADFVYQKAFSQNRSASVIKRKTESIKTYFKGSLFHELTQKDVQDYYSILKRTKVPVMAYLEISHLRKIYKRMEEWVKQKEITPVRLPVPDPFEGIKIQKHKEKKMVISKDLDRKCALLYYQADKELQRFLQVVMITKQKQGDICRLTRKNIGFDLMNKLIHLIQEDQEGRLFFIPGLRNRFEKARSKAHVLDLQIPHFRYVDINKIKGGHKDEKQTLSRPHSS